MVIVLDKPIYRTYINSHSPEHDIMMATIDRNDDQLSVEVEYAIEGDYMPTAWGYAGGSPEEYPELYITSVKDEEGNEVDVTFDEIEQLTKQCWDHANSYKDV